MRNILFVPVVAAILSSCALQNPQTKLVATKLVPVQTPEGMVPVDVDKDLCVVCKKTFNKHHIFFVDSKTGIGKWVGPDDHSHCAK